MYGRLSMCQLIANSHVLRAKFHAHAQSQLESPVDGRRIRDLQAAKHRFQSTQRPLSRCVLWLDALLATAHDIVACRDGAVRKAAQEFLDLMTEERVLSLALLADAGDEVSAVVRFYDRAGFDVASSPAEIQGFLGRIDALFVQSAVLRPESMSYTHHALKLLQRPRLLQSGRGQARSLGGPSAVTDQVIAVCMARMAAWVRLAKVSVDAEFPSWELFSAFGVFNLRASPSPVMKTQWLHRLATFSNVDAHRLSLQFNDHWLFARQELERGPVEGPEGTVTCFQAWASSVHRTRRRADMRQRHPSDALHTLLQRYGALCGASTSAVERAFAKLSTSLTKTRSCLQDRHVGNEIKLQLDLRQRDQWSAVAEQARQVWSEAFGASRLSGRHRRARRWTSSLKKTTPPVAAANKLTEGAWLERRRGAAHALGQQLHRPSRQAEADAVRRSVEAWTPSHASVGALANDSAPCQSAISVIGCPWQLWPFKPLRTAARSRTSSTKLAPSGGWRRARTGSFSRRMSDHRPSN